MTTRVNLKDTAGETIWSSEGWWYKIALADGTELGLGEELPSQLNNGRTFVQVVPAGQGCVFRYQRSNDDHRGIYGWPVGDTGYLRGIQVQENGKEIVKNLSIGGGNAADVLCAYDTQDSWGFVGSQLHGNRIALYAHNSKGELVGLRVMRSGHVHAHHSKHALALDCEFVKVGTWTFKDFF
jgi:hypothetical protein